MRARVGREEGGEAKGHRIDGGDDRMKWREEKENNTRGVTRGSDEKEISGKAGEE